MRKQTNNNATNNTPAPAVDVTPAPLPPDTPPTPQDSCKVQLDALDAAKTTAERAKILNTLSAWFADLSADDKVQALTVTTSGMLGAAWLQAQLASVDYAKAVKDARAKLAAARKAEASARALEVSADRSENLEDANVTDRVIRAINQAHYAAHDALVEDADHLPLTLRMASAAKALTSTGRTIHSAAKVRSGDIRSLAGKNAADILALIRK